MTKTTLDTPEWRALLRLRLTVRRLRDNPDNRAARIAAAHASLDYLTLIFGEGEMADAA